MDRLRRIFTPASPVTRPAEKGDKQRLANLIHFETRVHRHLDWRAPLDWIGCQAFFLTERGTQVQAALACPPDPPGIAWIHLFAVSSDYDPLQAWNVLWAAVLDSLDQTDCRSIVAIALQDWFRQILLGSGFKLVNQVIMLEWKRSTIQPGKESSRVKIRAIEIQDMPVLEALDRSAFGPIWHNSSESLEFAFRQAAIATVAEVDGEIAAYQISTSTQMGGHLARLATRPDFQRMGIGSALLQDLLTQFNRRGALRITVNTQLDNNASISLYEKAGFLRTGESYPVYQYNI